MTDAAASTALSAADQDALLRWRLALGSGAEKTSPEFGLGGLGGGAGAFGLETGMLGELDTALGFVYDNDVRGTGPGGKPYIPKWLGLLRQFFKGETVALLQKDAIERKGLTQLLFEPETLPYLEKNVDLVATLVSARGLVPDAAREIARQIVREVVEELRKKMAAQIQTAVFGALKRNTDSPLKIARNIDWKRTISRNLKGWDATSKRIVPDHFFFSSNQRKRNEWDVVMVVDQSGSMAASVVYCSTMAAIFASLDVLRTRMVLYSDDVVDVTDQLSDPVELLFAAMLGGGNNGKAALKYTIDTYLERPEKTIFLWITDLYEPPQDYATIVAEMRRITEAKGKAMVLLALNDGGRPAFDRELAARLEEIGVKCFGCTPNLLVRVMERVLKGQDISTLVAQDEKKK